MSEPSAIRSAATPPQPQRLRGRLAFHLDDTAARALLAWRRLGREMAIFAQRMESDILPAARDARRTECRVNLSTGSAGLTATIAGSTYPLGPFDVFADFMDSIGVDSMLLDADLEFNQIQDILRTLWCARGPLRGGSAGLVGRLLGHGRLCAALGADEGLHMSCATVVLDAEDRQLRVANTYCQLTFSRAVTAYMNRVSRFPDHRAFFVAAPKYALLAALVILAPALLVLYGTLSHGVVLVLYVTLAALTAVATLVVTETVGAVQYDKEHQAKELAARHAALVEAYSRIELDLERARRIQKMLIRDADQCPLPDRVATANWFCPEMAVGGDYFDMKRIGEERMAILFADVSGHGMSGAFITGLIKTIFEIGFGPDEGPSGFVKKVNRLLEHMTPLDSFAAMICAVYDAERRVLSYCVAGHAPLPVIIRRDDGGLEALDKATGMIVGVQADTPYETARVALEPGDKVAFCTDGITDATDDEGRAFGLERLHRLFREHVAAAAAALRDRIAAAVTEHAGQQPQYDDQTVLIMEVLR